MSLRSDSIYRVDLRQPPTRTSEPEDDDSPPEILQIRLTEQALQQLANAYADSDSARPQIRIDVNLSDPLLVIGGTNFQLHAPLPTASETASSSTAPHELYKLSKDESTLHKIGTISSKFSVKPTRDVSAVAQRLKQQKEEEEHRKEERRKALILGASPQIASSSSSKSGINKNLASVRAAGGSSLLSSSSLARSSSSSRLPSRREPSLVPATSLSRGVSREPLPGSRIDSPATGHAKLQGASSDDGRARRTARAITDSPQISAAVHSATSSRTHDAGVTSVSRSLAIEEEGQLSEEESPRRTALHSSPASAASDATKKSSKLTTRQRLAKATKAGSRLLAVSERHATPERRTASASASAHNPPSLKPIASNVHATAESIKRPDTVSDSISSQPRAAAIDRAKEALTDAPVRKARLEREETSIRGRELGKEQEDKARKAPTPAPKPGSQPSVQVVTMRKSRPSVQAEEPRAAISRPPAEESDERAYRQDLPARADIKHRRGRSTDVDTRSFSSTTGKQTAQQSDDQAADPGRRKRRRTNDFVSSDDPAVARGRQRSTSPRAIARTDESFVRRRDTSREGSIRRRDTTPTRHGAAHGSLPPSASMPSFAPSHRRLGSVAEAPDRDPRSTRAREYHDRRRDRSYDELAPDSPQPYRNESPHRSPDPKRSSQRSNDRTASAERPIKGVGPGATHWSEPWLDVRSTSDWHRLAQRFAKTQEEYLAARKRLEAERERLDRELELAAQEEQTAPAEQSLPFSPHDDVVMRDLDKETAVNTSINSRTVGTNAREKKLEEEEEPEEGEMRSSDDEEGEERRSESPDNIAWRPPAGGGRGDGAERPLGYSDLAVRVKELGELHGSLSRMHKVLVDFKAKEIATAN